MEDGIVDDGKEVGKVDGYSLGVTLGATETIFVGLLVIKLVGLDDVREVGNEVG